MTGTTPPSVSASPVPVFSSESQESTLQTSASPVPMDIQSSTTPPPRPVSSQGVSVIAPKPMRLPLFRPQFSRPPVSMYEMYTSEKDRVGSPNAMNAGGVAGLERRSSSASNTGFHQDDTENGGESRAPIYSPTKDALEELYKIMHKRSTSNASNSNTSGLPIFAKPKALQPRSPNMLHRRDPSDTSESSITGLPRRTPDLDWRISLSPVARNLNRNPIIRDPSFNADSNKPERS